MIIKYSLDLNGGYQVEGHQAESLLLLAEGELQADPEQVLVETGKCEFSIFGRKFSIKVIDRG